MQTRYERERVAHQGEEAFLCTHCNNTVPAVATGTKHRMRIEQVGWSPVWQNAFARHGVEFADAMPARVIRDHYGAYTVMSETGERLAEVSGNFRHSARGRSDYPAVGDWVVLQVPDAHSRCVIHAVLPRLSAFIRKGAGRTAEEQVVAANIDTAFLVSGLDNNFNPRRIERYITLAYESGADPVILLNKADCAMDAERARLEIESIAYGIPVLVMSATQGFGVDAIWAFLKPGSTGALLGSSGVGKTSLINALLGDDTFRTASVREKDSRGRHTTSYRQLIPLSNGAVLIDTPGMRELQLLAGDSTINRAFDEIAEWAESCRFKDCSHTGEPDCAVQAALATGELSLDRYESYLRQRKEIRHHQIESDIHLKIAEQRRWKAIHKSLQHHIKYRRDR